MRRSGKSRARTGRRLLAATVAAVAAAAGLLAVPAAAEPATATADEAAAAAVPSTVRQYAPFVYLAPDERFTPVNARRFIRQSSLTWAHDSNCRDTEVAPRRTVDGTRLGSGGYQNQIADALCFEHGDQHRSNELTRPQQGDKGDVPEDEGFFLNLPNRLRGGHGTAAPAYYEYVPRSYVTYWFFYAFNEAPTALTNAFDHEGDWERISVRLNEDDEAVTVAYYAHTGYCTRPWSEAGRHDGHPLAYSAIGTHATYAWLGEYDIAGGLAQDVTGRGAGWATYEKLRNARTQGWYGYGGAWGEVGDGPDSTGPLGPSQYKAPAPTDWSRPCVEPS